MTVTVTEAVKKEAQEKGFAKSGDIGGQPKRLYWTPDGRQILAMPDIHEFSRVQNGVPLSGIRDANLDRGWLLEKPSQLKRYCPHCDLWHDSEEEIKRCGAKRKSFVSKHSKLVKKELTPDENRINQLEKDVGEIKELLKQLIRKGA